MHRKRDMWIDKGIDKQPIETGADELLDERMDR